MKKSTGDLLDKLLDLVKKRVGGPLEEDTPEVESWELVSKEFTLSPLVRGTGPNKTSDLSKLMNHEASVRGFVKENGYTIGPSLGLYVNKVQIEREDETNLFNVPEGLCNALLTPDNFSIPNSAKTSEVDFSNLTLRETLLKSILEFEATYALESSKNKMLVGETYIERMFVTSLCFYKKNADSSYTIRTTYLYEDVDDHNDLLNKEGYSCGLLDYMEFENNMYCKLHHIPFSAPLTDEKFKTPHKLNIEDGIVLFDYSPIKALRGTDNSFFKNIAGVVKGAKYLKETNLINKYYADPKLEK